MTKQVVLCVFLIGVELGLSIAVATPVTTPPDIPPGLGLSPDGQAISSRDAKHPQKILQEVSGTETKHWDQTPIPITLSVGTERIVHFQGNVRVGVPQSLANDLRSQVQNGNVYWLAQKPFNATRIQVQDLQSKSFYLIDLSATDQPGASGRLEIVNTPFGDTPDLNPNASSDTAKLPGMLETLPQAKFEPASETALPNTNDFLILTRFAAQQLYAPKRLLKNESHIQSVSMDLVPIDHFMRGTPVLAEPVAAWRKGRLYVTAIKLTNQSAQPLHLDPRLIRGEWRTATFQHASLGPSFSDHNVTVVYLVSDHPFKGFPNVVRPK